MSPEHRVHLELEIPRLQAWGNLNATLSDAIALEIGCHASPGLWVDQEGNGGLEERSTVDADGTPRVRRFLANSVSVHVVDCEPEPLDPGNLVPAHVAKHRTPLAHHGPMV